MQHQQIDTANATRVELIEAKIVLGFEHCKPISEIAAEIAALLAQERSETA